MTENQLFYLKEQFELLGPNKSGFISLQNLKSVSNPIFVIQSSLQHAVAEKGKWNLQALVKNSTDAMKDSRVIDFVNTVSLLHSIFSCMMYWTETPTYLPKLWCIPGMHPSVQKIGFRRVCGFRHQRISDGSSGDLGTARSARVRAVRQGGQPAYRDRRTCFGTSLNCTLNILRMITLHFH